MTIYTPAHFGTCWCDMEHVDLPVKQIPLASHHFCLTSSQLSANIWSTFEGAASMRILLLITHYSSRWLRRS